MRFSASRAGMILALAVLAPAALIQNAAHESGMTCFTTKGTSLIKAVATHYETVSVTATKTQTLEEQSTTTIVPADETYIKTVIVTATVRTTADAFTNGVVATSTSTKTSTKSASRQTVTKTATITHTTTVSSTKTTTVSTTSGFVPIKSTINVPSMAPPGGEQDVERIKVRRRLEGLSKAQSKAKYPQQVDCKFFVTVTSTTTVTATDPTPYSVMAFKPMITHMTIATVTSVDTVFTADQKKVKVPILYTTVTVSTSPPPVTTTKTITKTKTTTDVIPGPTVYAACLAGPNMYSYPETYYSFYDVYGAQFDVAASGPKNSYDCCALCFSQFNCAGGLYQLGAASNFGTACNFETNEVCGAQPSTQITANFIESDGNYKNPAPAFNGNCGEVTFAQYIGD